MQKIISCKVTDEYVQGTGAVIGAVGSHDDAALELSFSSIWDGTTKRIVWFDALGQNPTLTVLTTDLLVPGELEVYRVPIPGEAKTVAGNMMMSIRGVIIGEDGMEDKAVVSATATFVVLESVWSDDASESEDITPSQAEQLQAEVDAIKGDISKAVHGVDAIEETLKAAQGYAQSAEESNVSAGNYSVIARDNAATAIQQANAASNYADKAEEAAKKAENIVGGEHIPVSEKGEPGGVATLGNDGKVPADQLPEMASPDAIEVEGGAIMILEGDFGDGPHTIEVTPDGEEQTSVTYESADHPGCFYRLVGAEREWINPPMLAGVEYRTPERYMGKPVYAKLVDCGTPPNASQKSVAHGAENVEHIVGYAGEAYHGTGSISLPYDRNISDSTAYAYRCELMVNVGAVVLTTLNDVLREYIVYVTIKYTKTTD